MLHEHGARVIFGGEVLSDHGRGAGNFVAPTLAEVPRDEHPCWERDRLLPVVMMRRYRSSDRAVAPIRDLKRARTVRVHGDEDETAWFKQAFVAAAEQSDAHAPAGATSAWPSLQASMRAEEDAADMVPALRAYLSQYLRTETESGTP